MGRARRRDATGDYAPIDAACGRIEVRVDGTIATVLIDQRPSSALDLSDPTHLTFGYMQWMDAVVAAAGGLAEGDVALHLGGAGCALPRAWAARYRGSRQVTAEIDPDMVAAARRWFALPRKPALSLRVQDGAEALAGAREGACRVVVRDAFAAGAVPGALLGEGFWSLARRAVDPATGLVVANCAAGLGPSRAEVDVAKRHFDSVALVGPGRVLRGEGGGKAGNLVVVAAVGELPEDALRRRLAKCTDQAALSVLN